jgi:hypothetical protein
MSMDMLASGQSLPWDSFVWLRDEVTPRDGRRPSTPTRIRDPHRVPALAEQNLGLSTWVA